MRQIVDKDISAVLSMLEKSDNEFFGKISEEFDKAQFQVVDYLYEVEDDFFTADERDLLINTVTFGWYIIKESVGCEAKIDADILDESLDKNYTHFDEHKGEIYIENEKLTDIMSERNNQNILMKFLLGFIFDRPENEDEIIRDEAIEIILIHLKTSIDVLLQV